MAANTNPIFGLVPVIGIVNLAAANTASDGSGTIQTLISGGTNGTRIDSVRFINGQATAAASSARRGVLWLSIDNGTTWSIYDEVAIATATRSVSVVGDKNDINRSLGIKLKDSTHKLGCTMSVYAGVQDRTTVIAEGMDY